MQDPRAAQRAKRRRLLTEALSARIRRGLIRYLEVIVDLSRASAMADFRPTRFAVVLGAQVTTDCHNVPWLCGSCMSPPQGMKDVVASRILGALHRRVATIH